METYSMAQRAFAEVLGTALLVLVGPGSVVATLVLAGDSTPAITGADLLGISFAFGLIITALVYSLGQGVRLSHQPGRDVRARGHQALPVARGPDLLGRAGHRRRARRARHLGRSSPRPAIDLGMGQTSFNEDTATYAQAIFAEGIGTFMLMFAILGIVDSQVARTSSPAS